MTSYREKRGETYKKMGTTSNTRVRDFVPLLSPNELKKRLPLDPKSEATVLEGRQTVENILSGSDRRLLAVVGPCSIHDEKAALEYAGRLKELRDELSDQLHIVMRVYFEKPRTKLGWRGLILDPDMDGSYEIDQGLHRAREILLGVNRLGLPAGSEMLDPIVPQYIDDLVSWASIGARTTESQTHREMASGLSMPVGFKNGTDGAIESALNAMSSSLHPHSFIGINHEGDTCVIHTLGNEQVHIILRGGRSGPNYYSWDIVRVEEMLRHNKLPGSIVVDCSHGNSEKDYRKQAGVLQNIITQRVSGRESIKGFMLESNLQPGRQDPVHPVDQLTYGTSITDACIGWDETEELLRETARRIAPGR
jgi:3-deoxy-7-phosphoheptulonate synthase